MTPPGHAWLWVGPEGFAHYNIIYKLPDGRFLCVRPDGRVILTRHDWKYWLLDQRWNLREGWERIG